MQLELIDRQCSPALKAMHREPSLLDLHERTVEGKYGSLGNHALKLASLVWSTYVDEQAFLLILKKNKVFRGDRKSVV